MLLLVPKLKDKCAYSIPMSLKMIIHGSWKKVYIMSMESNIFGLFAISLVILTLKNSIAEEYRGAKGENPQKGKIRQNHTCVMLLLPMVTVISKMGVQNLQDGSSIGLEGVFQPWKWGEGHQQTQQAKSYFSFMTLIM